MHSPLQSVQHQAGIRNMRVYLSLKHVRPEWASSITSMASRIGSTLTARHPNYNPNQKSNHSTIPFRLCSLTHLSYASSMFPLNAKPCDTPLNSCK